MRSMLRVMLAQVVSGVLFLCSCAGSSLSGTEDYGEDWCPYLSFDEIMAAYNWAFYPGFGGFWSDYNEPTEDYEGRLLGPYWNLSLPLDPTWQPNTVVDCLPFNGGSRAIDFDSAYIFAQTGRTTPASEVYAMTGQVPDGMGSFNFPPSGPTGWQKVTLVSRVWIDSTSDLDSSGNYVSPVQIWFISTGAFGEAHVYVGRFHPITNADAGSPRLWLYLWSYNNTFSVVIDCGSAADIIADAVGYEFSLTMQVIPATSSAYDQVEARLSAYPLPGATGTFAGTWIARVQNAMAQDSYPLQITVHNNGRTANYVHARTYSFEWWVGNKVWLGSSQPGVTSTTDTTPTPVDDSFVLGTLGISDDFTPRAPARGGLTSPTFPLVTVSPSWTKFNDGGFITSLDKTGLGQAVLTLASDGSGTPRGFYAACPQLVTDHTYSLGVPSGGAPAVEANAGTFLRLEETATGKWVEFGVHNNGTNRRTTVRTSGGGEVYRGSVAVPTTGGEFSIDRSAGNWEFWHNFGGYSGILYSAALATIFTTGPNRVVIGGWSGVSGHVLAYDYLHFA
jgi:hypothetical protein